MAITPTTSTFFIQFGLFEPINVEIFSTPNVTSNVLKDNSGTSIMFCHKEPSVVDDEGWTLVTLRRNRKATSLTQSREALRRLRIVKKLTKMNKSKGTETTTLPLAEISAQDFRQPVTLQEFMPKQFQEDIFTSVTCYLINGEVSSNTEGEIESSRIFRSCVASIMFTNEDRLLGSRIHNRPLFVTGYIKEQLVNRILIDGGSAVKILPLKVLKDLGISLDQLSHSRLMIQGFNQDGQRAIGKIRLNMLIGDIESNALFHVIDARTSYKPLLGRPWLHKYGVVPSTYHRCFKYFQDGQIKKVMADDKPFTKAKSFFADAKFYLEDDTLEGIQVITPPSTEEVKLQYEIPKPDLPAEVKEEAKQNENSKGKTKQQGSETVKLTPVLRYVPITKRKEGQSPFFGDENSILKSFQELTLPVAKITKTTLSCQPLKGFVRPSQAPTIQHGSLPTKCTEEGFDPNAYRLMAKAGYNHNEPNGLGRLIPEASGEKDHDLTKTQKMLKAQGYGVAKSKARIGYTPSTPIHIPIRKTNVLVITTGAEEEEQFLKPSKKGSVFNRLGRPTSQFLVFDRLGPQESHNLVANTRNLVHM